MLVLLPTAVANTPTPRSIVNLDGSTASGVAGIVSYTDAGKCEQISGCGQCCRTAVLASVQQASMTPDQVNTAGWTKASTNLVNDAEQTFTPSVPRLLGGRRLLTHRQSIGGKDKIFRPIGSAQVL